MEQMNLLEGLFERTEQKPVDGDYDVDGIVYCGICHTPKQIRKMYLGKERIFWHLCECQATLAEMKEKEERRALMLAEIELRKQSAFHASEMLGYTFEADDNSLPKITTAMKEYVNQFKTFLSDGRGLLLWGLVDGGKTFYACCVLNALLDLGYTCKATSFPELAAKSFDTFDKTGFFQSYNEYDMLLIDDLGTERRTEYMQEIIYGVIDARYQAKLPMIITTNLNIKDISKPQDMSNARIFSRIIERCYPIQVPQTNHRIRSAREEYFPMKKILGV